MNKILLAGAFALGCAAPAGAATLSPYALYTFDNGLATDDSGNGNTGTVHAGAGTGLSHDGSTALALSAVSGTSGIETPIDINVTAMPTMSMGAWVYAYNIGQGPGGKVLSHDNGQYGRTIGIDSRGDDAGYDWTAFGGPTTQVVDAVDRADPLGTWVHLAVVYNGANSGLYINGMLDSSFSDTTSTVPGLTAGLFIGTNNYYNEDFVGLVDDVFVFDQALTEAQVDYIYQNGFATSPAPVPVPAGLPLLVMGLGAFAMLRRKA